MSNATFTTIDEYLQTCDENVVNQLNIIRKIIKENAPMAVEKISWGMPTFFYKQNVVHFFAHKKHIGFYPSPSGINHFKNEFDKLGFKYSKGAVQFPLSKEIPYDLIAQITAFRIEEISKQFNQ